MKTEEDVCVIISIHKAHRYRWLRRTLEPAIQEAEERLALARQKLAADPEQANRELREIADQLRGRVATG